MRQNKHPKLCTPLETKRKMNQVNPTKPQKEESQNKRPIQCSYKMLEEKGKNLEFKNMQSTQRRSIYKNKEIADVLTLDQSSFF